MKGRGGASGRGEGGFCGSKSGLHSVPGSFFQVFLRQLQTWWPGIPSETHQYCWTSCRDISVQPSAQDSHSTKTPDTQISPCFSAVQNSSHRLRSTRRGCPTEMWCTRWDLWESRTAFPRQAAFPASSLAPCSFSEPLYGNYAEERIQPCAHEFFLAYFHGLEEQKTCEGGPMYFPEKLAWFHTRELLLSLSSFLDKTHKYKVDFFFPLRVFLELFCILWCCLASVACWIAHCHFYSLYSHRSADQLVSLIALILFCCFGQIRAVKRVIACQDTSNLLP